MLLSKEQHYLDTLQPYYNILDKAGSSLGSKHTENTKLLLSEMKKNHKMAKIIRFIVVSILNKLTHDLRSTSSRLRLV